MLGKHDRKEIGSSRRKNLIVTVTPLHNDTAHLPREE